MAQQIQLQVQLGPEEYARYSTIVGKRQSTWANHAIYAGAFFMAIPAAFAGKALAALGTANPVAIDLVGRFSLFAFFAGILTLTLAISLIHRRVMARTLSSTPGAFDSRTVVLDENEVSITGKLSQARWAWPAITRVTAEQGLVLFWIGSQDALIVPDLAFASREARNDAIAFARARIAQAQSAEASS